MIDVAKWMEDFMKKALLLGVVLVSLLYSLNDNGALTRLYLSAVLF